LWAKIPYLKPLHFCPPDTCPSEAECEGGETPSNFSCLYAMPAPLHGRQVSTRKQVERRQKHQIGDR